MEQHKNQPTPQNKHSKHTRRTKTGTRTRSYTPSKQNINTKPHRPTNKTNDTNKVTRRNRQDIRLEPHHTKHNEGRTHITRVMNTDHPQWNHDRGSIKIEIMRGYSNRGKTMGDITNQPHRTTLSTYIAQACEHNNYSTQNQPNMEGVHWTTRLGPPP